MTNIVNTYEAFLELQETGGLEQNNGLQIPLAKAAVAGAGGIMMVGSLAAPAGAAEKVGETPTHSIYEMEKNDKIWNVMELEGYTPQEREEKYPDIAAASGFESVHRVKPGDLAYIPKKQPVVTEAAPTPAPVSEMPALFEDYVAQDGDYVIKLAKSWGVSKEWVIENNPELADNPDFLRIGQVLKKPLLSPPPAVEAAPPAVEAIKEETITIQPGDTLDVIAAKRNTTADALAARNGISNKHRIFAGKPLTVPTFEEVPAAVAEVPTPTVEAPAAPAAPTPAPVAPVETSAVVADSAHINREWNIPMGEGTAYPDQAAVDAFKQKVEAISAELQVDPDHLMAVMAFETAGTFNPGIKNGAGSGATGLIQFMPKTAEGMGLSTDELARMTPTEQLEQVKAYFISSAGQLTSLEDVYLKVFFPAAIGKGPDYALPGWTYKQNKGFDKDKDGRITVAEISTTVRDRHEAAPVIEAVPAPAPAEVPVEIGEPAVEERTPEAAPALEIAPEQPEAPAEPEVQVEAAMVEQQAVPNVRPPHLDHDLIDWQNVEQTTDGDGNPMEIVRVAGGDHVDVEIALNLARMLEAAKADGIDLTVYSGHRSIEEQEALRAQHGCAGVLIYDRSCKGKPHTAIPGRSNHNGGKAVDFQFVPSEAHPDIGKRINTKDHIAFLWLAERAAEFGFQNYDPEPWHWSPDGK